MNDFTMKQVQSLEEPEEVPDDEGENDNDRDEADESNEQDEKFDEIHGIGDTRKSEKIGATSITPKVYVKSDGVSTKASETFTNKEDHERRPIDSDDTSGMTENK